MKRRITIPKISRKVLLVVAACIVIIAAFIFLSRTPGMRIKKFEGFTPFDTKQLDQNIIMENKELSVIAVGSYSGEYVEDGTDEEIENVAALIVQNVSDQTLQIAEIELKINDDHTALFRMTNLPSNGMVMALDLNKNICGQESKAEKISEAVRFFDKVPMNEDVLATEGSEGRLTLKNLSEDTYDKVYVYYKTEIDKDLYLGGITYRIPFEEIEGKTQIQTDAGHYSPDKSKIVEVQILKEQNNKKKEEKE